MLQFQDVKFLFHHKEIKSDGLCEVKLIPMLHESASTSYLNIKINFKNYNKYLVNQEKERLKNGQALNAPLTNKIKVDENSLRPQDIAELKNSNTFTYEIKHKEISNDGTVSATIIFKKGSAESETQKKINVTGLEAQKINQLQEAAQVLAS